MSGAHCLMRCPSFLFLSWVTDCIDFISVECSIFFACHILVVVQEAYCEYVCDHSHWSGLSSKVATVTLLPYMIFSLFHALTFTRTTLLPRFLPPGPPSTANGAPGPHPYAKKLQVWVKGICSLTYPFHQ